MKPFFGIDVTEEKKNDQMNGEEFLVKSVSDAQSEQYDRIVEGAEKFAKRTEPSLLWTLARGVCGIAALGMIAGILQSWSRDLSLGQMYANAPMLFWALPVCALAWLILTILGRRRAARILESGEAEEVAGAVQAVTDASYAALGVPEGTPDVDVLCMIYKLHNGQPTPKLFSLSGVTWINAIAKVFTDGGSLYVADTEKLYAIPLSSLKGIRAVNKGILLPSWNKDVPLNEEPYKSFKLAVVSMDRIHVKRYYILEFEHNGESWGLYFPNYELKTFESLTGLNAEPSK